MVKRKAQNQNLQVPPVEGIPILVLDKIIKALNTTSEEIFATNHIKESNELLREINSDIEYLSKNPQKLETLYNLVKALKKE